MDPALIETVHELKFALSSLTGLSNDACHVHVGFAVFFTVAIGTKGSRSYVVPWLVCLLIAGAGEWIDRSHDLQGLGAWRWWESVHDIVNTMFWPTVLTLVGKGWGSRASRWATS